MRQIDMTPHLKKDAEQAAINAQRRADYEAYVKRRNEEHRKVCDRISRQTQMAAYQRKLSELKFYLRHDPQNEALREEHDRVEAAYKELRDSLT